MEVDRIFRNAGMPLIRIHQSIVSQSNKEIIDSFNSVITRWHPMITSFFSRPLAGISYTKASLDRPPTFWEHYVLPDILQLHYTPT